MNPVQPEPRWTVPVTNLDTGDEALVTVVAPGPAEAVHAALVRQFREQGWTRGHVRGQEAARPAAAQRMSSDLTILRNHVVAMRQDAAARTEAATTAIPRGMWAGRVRALTDVLQQIDGLPSAEQPPREADRAQGETA